MPLRIASPAVSQVASLAGLALLAMLGGAAAAPSGQPADPWIARDAGPSSEDDALLGLARERVVRAEVTVDGLKRAMNPSHLTDPMPDLDRPLGLDSLRSDYAALQLKAAGYRATLGDQHPTLVAAEAALADLRRQLLDGTRKALAAAERDAAAARVVVGTIERRIAARATAAAVRAAHVSDDVTGSIATDPLSEPSARIDGRAHPDDAMASPDALAQPADAVLPARNEPSQNEDSEFDRLRRHLRILALAGLAALVAAWVLLHAFGASRRLSRSAVRPIAPEAIAATKLVPTVAVTSSMPPLEAEPEDRTAVALEPLPILAALPLALDMAEAFARTSPRVPPDSALALAATRIHATLQAAVGREGRMTVLLSPAENLPEPDADAAALALALVAAMAGQRTLLMEARPAGRFRRGLVPANATPALLDVGGTARTLYRLAIAGLAVAVLPSDAGEAEVARDAGHRPETACFSGLSNFDTVVMVGNGPDRATLARAADLTLVMAPPGTTAAALEAAAEPLRGAERPCGVLLIEPAPVARDTEAAPADTADLRPAAASAGLRGSLAPFRRIA